MTTEREQAIQDLMAEKQIPDHHRIVVMSIAQDIILPAIEQGKIPGYIFQPEPVPCPKN